MSKAEKTKQFIIEKTATLFNTKGYASTSLSDISSATGLTKGSIYGNFENKDQVALEAYCYNAFVLKKNMAESLNKEFPTVTEKLNVFLSFYRKNWKTVFQNGGCPLLNAATECDDTFPELIKQVQVSFSDWIGTLSEIIEEGQNHHEFNPEISAEEYASLFIMMIEGGILLAKTMENEKYLHFTLDKVSKIIEQELKIHS
ncbi:TetR/AcrR family transcriptional regulator [Chryseobacterium echinoideorum]|uniref:TetR/AcrR family transcriptional regulator n=1 Tax=Chryseobacterium echinoideorum TaxID=1549648 RepID=UPI0011856543|nr:TetR/AcrR family transcriptional regulator [Chryseobacterium echinoideorum]